jgi:hypothetical protein
MDINEKLNFLENKIKKLEATIKALSDNTESKFTTPISIVGGTSKQGLVKSVDTRAGRGLISGGSVVFNNTEIDAPYGTQPAIPTIGYNRHAHSRYSGGALINDVIEVVEYNWGIITNKHSQGFLKPEDQPSIAMQVNSKGEAVEKIGLLDLVFNPDGGYDSNGNPIGSWGVTSYEIDIKKCYLVERVTIVDGSNPTLGAIKKDSKGQEMKAPLYNADVTKTSIVWDENGNCWRLYCAYAPGV